MTETVSEAGELLTLGQVSNRLDVPQHRVKYAISMAQIEPVARVGILRVFSPNQLLQIETAIRAVRTRLPKKSQSLAQDVCPVRA